jgi:hypothetical protein
MRFILVALLAIALLAQVAPAFADPGAPGLDRPSSAVYENSDERPVLNQRESGGGQPPVVAGETEGGAEEAASFDESLPFTGLSAALVLSAGLALLLLGLTARTASRRLHRP